MILLAPAKVNLCLFLGPVRGSDGRHELVTVFEPLSLTDRLELSFGAVDADTVVCPGVEGPNLVSDALALMRRAGWDAPPVRVAIDKRIPVAAGMGGGSSDAAAVLGLMAEQIDVYPLARTLGADVSALVEPGLVLATGAGDTGMRRFPADLGERAYVVVPAHGSLSTAAVYREADRLGVARPAHELAALVPELEAGLEAGRFPPDLLVNDLAAAACSLMPAIEETLAAVRDAGADVAMVSGSGPTVVGVLWGTGAATRAQAATAALSARSLVATTAVPFPGSSQSGPVL